jgi:hypothetical protein
MAQTTQAIIARAFMGAAFAHAFKAATSSRADALALLRSPLSSRNDLTTVIADRSFRPECRRPLLARGKMR